MQATMVQPKDVEAVAEIFWLAFNTLSKPEKEAVLDRLQPVSVLKTRIVSVPAHTLQELGGLVAWGGDALEDTERLYDNL